MTDLRRLGLFEGYGIEIEYMIVDARTLDVAPVSDRLIERASGVLGNEFERGFAAWSNELVLHVIEFKSNGPLASLERAGERFHGEVLYANALLAEEGRMLLPTGMHPWMDPEREMRLWPHDDDRIYRAFDRIFDCRGHGWANLQSVHVNLPFDGDEEFARLHAAIRAVLPMLPALAASSPAMDGRLTGRMDSRLAVYRDNCARIPSITGRVIPEAVYGEQEYRERILEPMWRDIERHDPDRLLREEWLNARGAIARFERSAIEIRVLDVQECAAADLAVVDVVVGAVRALAEESWAGLERVCALPLEGLVAQFDDCVARAGGAGVGDAAYLELFGAGPEPCSARRFWHGLTARLVERGFLSPASAAAAEPIVTRGSLAERIVAVCSDGGRESLERAYRRLGECLAAGERFG